MCGSHCSTTAPCLPAQSCILIKNAQAWLGSANQPGVFAYSQQALQLPAHRIAINTPHLLAFSVTQFIVW